MTRMTPLLERNEQFAATDTAGRLGSELRTATFLTRQPRTRPEA
jgi:hypothetical protein